MAGSIREGVAGLYLMTFPPSLPAPVDIGPPAKNWYLCHLIVTDPSLSGHLGHSLMLDHNIVLSITQLVGGLSGLVVFFFVS